MVFKTIKTFAAEIFSKEKLGIKIVFHFFSETGLADLNSSFAESDKAMTES